MNRSRAHAPDNNARQVAQGGGGIGTLRGGGGDD